MKTLLPRRIAATILLSVAALLLSLSSACQTQTEPTAPASNTQATLSRERTTGVRGGSLAYRVTSPPKTLNSLMIADEASYTVAFMLLGARLIDFDHDAQRYVPALAESWQLGEDKKTLELTLREGLKFSDGQPLTAEDVAFTLRAIYDERTNSAFRTTLTIGDKQIEAQPLDARRIRFVFPETVAAPETYLVNVAVLPRHVLEPDLKKGTLGKAYELTSDPSRVVAAGAFAVEAVAPGERVALKRNPHYWKRDAAGNQLPYLDRLVVEVVGDANAAIARLNEGAVDIIDRIRITDYAALQNPQGAVRAYDVGPGLSTDHLWFNLNESGIDGQPLAVDAKKQAWFKDVRFRRAVAHAIDREGIASSTLQGLATPLYGFVSPGNRAWVADIPRTEYSLERARALLAEAGFVVKATQDAPELYDAGGNRVEWTLIVPVENEARKAMAAVIQEDLSRLGMKMQIAPLEFGEIVGRTTQSLNYEAVLLGAVVTDIDPSSYSNILSSASTQHQWHPKQKKPATEWEARIDTLLAMLARETDAERRRAVFREIQLNIVENQPVIPIAVRHIVSAANTRVGNYRPSAIIPYSLWNAEELFIKK
ncbi:MAG TPA: ABC transporter substrate-binding protein [Pyrinomonadaceae bacterium]|jgi:peptide/nickel transport system substrate-binding protein